MRVDDATRRQVLAAAVLDDVDLDLCDDGAVFDGLLIGWDEVRHTAGDQAPDSPAAIASLRVWVAARRWLQSLAPSRVQVMARPVGLPVGHALHPGPMWAVEHVLGGCLDVGLGLRGLGGDPEGIGILDPVMASAAGIDIDECWAHADAYRVDMARRAAAHAVRHPLGTLRSVGDCDVPTLLSSANFREALASVDNHGMRSAAVPVRTHGWLDLGLVDPTFAETAAATVAPRDRGFDRALLLTRDEVVQVRTGGDHRLRELMSSPK